MSDEYEEMLTKALERFGFGDEESDRIIGFTDQEVRALARYLAREVDR